MILIYKIFDILGDNEESCKYHEKFVSYGFDICKDRKKAKITDNEYMQILQDITEPILYNKSKGKLQRSKDGLIFFRKLYVNFRNVTDLLRVVVLVYEFETYAFVLPFHIFLKSNKKKLDDWEIKIMDRMIASIEKNEGELK